jgi:anti-anti-sigma regulatory factor
VVINTDPQLRRVFELTGLKRVLNVVPDREQALALIGDGNGEPQP